MKPASVSARLGILACALAATGCGAGTGAVFPRHAILTGVIVNVSRQPQSVTENPIETTKEGDSCAHSFAIPFPFVWLGFAFMNASAKKATPTDRIAVVDRSSIGILGVYANSCTLVTPGGKSATAEAAPAPADTPPPAAVTPATPDQKGVSGGDSGPWPKTVPIASRATCSFVCIPKEGASPKESDKAALAKALDKHLGALRACVGGTGKTAAAVNVSFDSRGSGIVNYSFGPRATPRADCPGSFPPVKNITGPANATWQCTDYCE